MSLNLKKATLRVTEQSTSLQDFSRTYENSSSQRLFRLQYFENMSTVSECGICVTCDEKAISTILRRRLRECTLFSLSWFLSQWGFSMTTLLTMHYVIQRWIIRGSVEDEDANIIWLFHPHLKRLTGSDWLIYFINLTFTINMYVHFFHLINSYMNEKVRVNITSLSLASALFLFYFIHKKYININTTSLILHNKNIVER